MNRRNRLAWLGLFACLGGSAFAANLPADWQYAQSFEVAAPGLVKLSLPVATLDAARPALEDLRLYDDAGNELPYLIQHPVPAARAIQSAKSFQVALKRNATVITLETGLSQPLDGVVLESPANNFIKSAQIEASTDGQRWQNLAQGRPIFRQPGGASQLHLAVPAGVRPWLRLTLDDERSQPIPITGVQVQAAAGETAPSEPVLATIAERHENPGETRLTLNLGAANLNVTSIEIATPAPLFTRRVTLVEAQVSEDVIRERTLAQGTIYRVAVDGQPVSTNLTVALDRQVRSRELLVLLQNQDSPPLPISAVRAERRPVYLVFLAPTAGPHHLLAGNRRCGAPRYDLAGLGANLKSATTTPVKLSPPGSNPNYRAAEVLPGVESDGSTLDLAAWRFRKPLTMTRAGAQQVELDLDVLAHAQSDFADLRLVRDGRQLPYVLQRTSINRAFTPGITATNDARVKVLSCWIIKLPRPGLPIMRLSCTSPSMLFEREMTLSEEAVDERGEKHRRNLGRVIWTQTPERQNRELTLTLEGSTQGDTLFLETHNGDNPPIELEKFQLFHVATRVLFKAKPEDPLFLYYGNPRVASPHYDLNLVAGQLLAADKSPAALGGQEQLKKASWAEGRKPGRGGVVFWGALSLVVVVLLVVVSRLLPKATSS